MSKAADDIAKIFLSQIDFVPPHGFVDFLSLNGGQEFKRANSFVITWPLDELVTLNTDYQVDEYAPGYFIFGTDGGSMAFCIDKVRGSVCRMPFVGMADDIELLDESFERFVNPHAGFIL